MSIVTVGLPSGPSQHEGQGWSECLQRPLVISAVRAIWSAERGPTREGPACTRGHTGEVTRLRSKTHSARVGQPGTGSTNRWPLVKNHPGQEPAPPPTSAQPGTGSRKAAARGVVELPRAVAREPVRARADRRPSGRSNQPRRRGPQGRLNRRWPSAHGSIVWSAAKSHEKTVAYRLGTGDRNARTATGVIVPGQSSICARRRRTPLGPIPQNAAGRGGHGQLGTVSLRRSWSSRQRAGTRRPRTDTTLWARIGWIAVRVVVRNNC